MTTPPDVLRRQIMLTVYGARPELGTDGAGEVADALLAGDVGQLAAKVARVEAVADWYDGGGEGVPRLAGRGATSNAYAAIRIRQALDGAAT